MSEIGPEADDILPKHLEGYFNDSLAIFNAFFVPGEADRYKGQIQLNLILDKHTGIEIPTCTYKKSDPITMQVNVEVRSCMDFANRLHQLTDVNESDIQRLSIAAGVARAALGYKTLPIRDRGSPEQRKELQDALFDSRPLLAFADEVDPLGTANVRSSIERMGEDEISAINALRFAFGAGLHHAFNDMEAFELIEKVRVAFLEDQGQRTRDLSTALAVLGMRQEVFSFYDDTVDHILLALSSPMSPAEEMNLLAVQR